MTFAEAVRAGKAKLEDVDDWVEDWHNGAGGDDQTLKDYLGFDDALYSAWLRNANAISVLLNNQEQ